MISATTLLSLIAATAICDVELSGDPDLIGQVRARLDLSPVDGMTCSKLAVRLRGTPESVLVTATRKTGTTVQIVDLETAHSLIESWALAPLEARPARTVVRPPKRLFQTIRSLRHARRTTTPNGWPDFRFRGGAEFAVGNDGSAWWGPTVGVSISSKAWSGGASIRYAVADDTGRMFEVGPHIGRDIVYGRLRIEPRGSFAIRSLRRPAESVFISTCGSIVCPIPDGGLVISPEDETVSFDMAIGAETTVSYELAEWFVVWGAAGVSIPIAVRLQSDDVRATSPPHDLVFGRLSIGGRVQL